MRKPAGRPLIVAVGVLVTAAVIIVRVTLATQGSGIHWARVWSDSFNGPASGGIDERYWTYETGHGGRFLAMVAN